MKRRLFWKILIGFWITLLIITQGIWLMFTLLRPQPEQSEYLRGMANMAVAAATSAIREGGDQALVMQMATWPHEQRDRIKVRNGTGRDVSQLTLAQAVAAAPDGKHYLVAYHFQPDVRAHGIFNIPREVVIVATIGGLGFSAILAWYLTQPINSMRAGFGRLAGGDFTTRLGPAMGRRRDEIADLAYDFDKMAIRLAELVAARDRLLADVSHELRTPLARLTLAIELARQDPAKIDNSLARIGNEAAKLDEMVGELLTLAKMESGQSRGEDYFDLAEVVKAVIQDARYEATAKTLDVVLDIQPVDEAFEWLVRGNGKLVARAVENIIRNGLRYSPEGGKVHVGLRQEAGFFRLSVTDQGPGVPDDLRESLFKPFIASGDGFGFGLGLAIAQRAIVVHGGTISARNQNSKGLEMLVVLPAATMEQA
jgi:two-component system OmpR family sensor kinase